MPTMFDFLVTLALGIFIGATSAIAIAFHLVERENQKLRNKLYPLAPVTSLSDKMRVGPNPFETETQLYDQKTDTGLHSI